MRRNPAASHFHMPRRTPGHIFHLTKADDLPMIRGL
jgi:hypothetical protein